ncbi:MAG: PLP-dependent aminotransferase family protein [Gemmatimonadaceae bacterium]
MSVLQTTHANIPEGMIDLGVGQPTLSELPLDTLRTAADHALSTGNTAILQYGADHGDGYFRQTLARFLERRYNTPVDLDSLLITAGASQALDLICTRFTKPGDTIFVEEPTYFLALLIFRDHGLNVVGIPIDEHGMQMDALEQALGQHRPVLVYTIPTFQNPSAVTMSAERRTQLVALCKQHEFLIVADEVYHLLDFGGSLPVPFAAYVDSDRIISLGSFSKICAPGLRLGWVQGGAQLISTLVAAGLIESGGGLNPFTSAVMRSFIELGLQDACLDHFRTLYRARCASLCDALREHIPNAQFTEPQGGFFVWLRLPGKTQVTEIIEKSRRLGVGFQAGTRFGNGDAMARYVRMSFAHYETAELVEGAKRLGAALR